MPRILGSGVHPEVCAALADHDSGNAMLEVYSAGDMSSPDYECGIWAPVCKKNDQCEQETAETVATMTLTGIL